MSLKGLLSSYLVHREKLNSHFFFLFSEVVQISGLGCSAKIVWQLKFSCVFVPDKHPKYFPSYAEVGAHGWVGVRPLIHGQQTVAGRILRTCLGMMLSVTADTWFAILIVCRATTLTSTRTPWDIMEDIWVATKSWCNLCWVVAEEMSHCSGLLLWWTPMERKMHKHDDFVLPCSG